MKNTGKTTSSQQRNGVYAIRHDGNLIGVAERHVQGVYFMLLRPKAKAFTAETLSAGLRTIDGLFQTNSH